MQNLQFITSTQTNQKLLLACSSCSKLTPQLLLKMSVRNIGGGKQSNKNKPPLPFKLLSMKKTSMSDVKLKLRQCPSFSSAEDQSCFLYFGSSFSSVVMMRVFPLLPQLKRIAVSFCDIMQMMMMMMMHTVNSHCWPTCCLRRQPPPSC